MRKNLLAATVALLIAAHVQAGDWPQFRGPNHDGSCEKGWFNLWPSGEPQKLWTANVGAGCAGVIVVGGRLYAFGNNGSEELDKTNKSQDVIWCFDAETGKEIWKQAYEAQFLRVSDSGGPNATPACDGKCVVTVSKHSVVRCNDAESGKLLWERNFADEHKIDPKDYRMKFMYGGVASSPFIINNVVVANCQGLDRETGKTLYELKIEKGSFSRGPSPTPAMIKNKTEVMIAFSHYPKTGLLFFDPLTGTGTRELLCAVGSADPLMIDGDVFISDRAGKEGSGGSCLYSMDVTVAPPVVAVREKSGAPVTPAPKWQVKDDGSYWGNAVRWGDYVFTGEMKNMACVSIKTGEVKWREKSLSNAQPVVCDGKLLVLAYNKLLVLDAGPEYKVLASAVVLPATSTNPYAKFSLAPALTPGRLYVKQSNGDVACVDVSGK